MRRVPALCAAIALLLVACGGDDDGGNPTSSGTPTSTEGSASNALACSPALPHEPGEARRTLPVDGIERSYLLVVPDGYNGSTQVPVVLALHGLGGTGDAMRDITGIAPAAAQRGMISVFPNGTGEIPAWNINDFPGAPDDTAFMEALIDDLATVVCVDRSRIYATGFSNGGGMAQKLACDRPGLLAAIAPVGATYLFCTGKTAIIGFHGMRDADAPFEGATTTSAAEPRPEVRHVISQWARNIGCDAIARISRAAPGVELATYGNCPTGGDDALLYTIIEGEHVWPSRTNSAVDATAMILDFFAAH